jgi:sulfur relay (sulfurtransferase) DsrF/TusC family protein
MRVLQIIESAYRCTIEEQDDPAVWITHAMTGAGAEFGVLLRGNAVNYALTGQEAAGLQFGRIKQSQPPRIDHEVSKLVDKGINVYAIQEDGMERGIDPDQYVPGIQAISREEIPRLFDGYDQVWHW